MKTKTSKFILLAASALIIFAINPLPVLAQSSCPSYASLAITSSKTSYQVGEIFSGEVVFTNNIVPANVNFDVKAVKSGQTLISNNYTLATQVGRNVYQLTDALGVSSLPEAGVYTISIIASYPFPICSWNANLTLTATSPAPVAPPQIQQLIPDSRLPGEQVIIKGSNFTPTGNDVKSGTTVIASNLPSAGGDTIVFTVPGASPDQYPISVSNSRGASNEKTLTVLGAPRIDSLNPSSAPFGSTITINGSGFTPTGNNLKSGSVFFDLNISSPDGKTLTFIVPDVSPGSYPVAVQNQRGISNEASFTVLAAKPEIQSLNPSSAQPYTQITVKGANFTRTGNDVKSGATVIASGVPSNGTVLNFTVPDVSPGSYPVSVSNRRGVSNEVSFTVLPPPPVKLLTSLTILPSEYLLGQTVTGSVILTNPTPKEIKANFSIELYKDSTLFWQRQVKSLSIPPSPGPAPRVVSYSLDDVFGFKPTIPDNPSFVGNWKLLIKRTDTGPGAAPDDSVSQTFLIKAPFIPPLALTFNFDPKEYILGDTLQGKGTITNPGSLPVIADFKIELFQGTTLKWQREIKGISVPSGTSPFTVDDLFGFKVVIPNEVSLIGDWKLKISQIETTPPVSVESSFSIKSITAACKPTTGTPAAKAFGIVQGFFPWSTSPKDLDYMKELGVKWARLELVWDKIEPQRSQFNWEFYDTVVKSFEENNIQILGQFGSAPCWANGRPCPFQNPLEHDYPPTDLDAWANFVKKAAERYKPGGVLGLKTGITHWEIWNEPNIDIFWRPAPNPKEYANLLAVSNKAIREVDSKAIIVGVSEAGVEPTFVDAIYKAGAKNCFDVISLHPYGPVSELQGKTAGIKKFLKDHGDPDKPIWYTEYGFITGKSGEPGSVGPKVSEQEQAQYVKETYELFSQGVFPAMFWISLKDFGTPARPEDTFGLLRLDYSKKPAFDVLKNLLNPAPPLKVFPWPDTTEDIHPVLFAWGDYGDLWDDIRTPKIPTRELLEFIAKNYDVIENLAPADAKEAKRINPKVIHIFVTGTESGYYNFPPGVPREELAKHFYYDNPSIHEYENLVVDRLWNRIKTNPRYSGDFFAKTVKSIMDKFGYDGVRADLLDQDVRGGAGVVSIKDRTPEERRKSAPAIWPIYDYFGNRYQDDNIQFRQDMSALLRQAKDSGVKALIFNTNLPPPEEYGMSADGVMFEGFVVNVNESDPNCRGYYENYNGWQFHVSLAREVDKRGRAQFLTAVFPGSTDKDECDWGKRRVDTPEAHKARLFSLASYLLVKGKQTYFYYAPHSFYMSGPFFLPEWKIKIGKPLGNCDPIDACKLSNGLYQREFSNGRVIINPYDSGTISLDLSETLYQVVLHGGNDPELPYPRPSLDTPGSIEYRAVNKVTLGPKDAVILLKKVP